jgi:CSLREA domain-containing protein
MRNLNLRRTLTGVGALALSAGSLFVGAVAPAAAASLKTFKVNSTIDLPNAHPGSRVCADTAGKCTLRGAIQAANAQPLGTVISILVPAGTYGLRLGALSIGPRTVGVIGAGSAKTIIESAATAPVQLITVAVKARVTLTALKLTGGVATASNGGALFNHGATTLKSVAVTQNTALSGGGIANAKGASLTLVSSTVSNNTAASATTSGTGGAGGGILNAGGLTLTHSTVSANAAGMGGYGSTDPGGQGGSGGGIANTGTVTVTSSVIAKNAAGTGGIGQPNNEPSGPGGDGGGIYSSGGSLTLSNTTVTGNTSGYTGPLGEFPFPSAGDGGGIWSSAALRVTSSAFTSNAAETGTGLGGSGGAIFNSGQATVSSSTFIANVAGLGDSSGGDGGAIDNSGRLTLTGSTLASDIAGAGGGSANGGSGGGLYSTSGTVSLLGDTFRANSSGTGGNAIPVDPGCSRPGTGGDGGAIYSAATLTVLNSTISGNTTGKGGFDSPPCLGEAPNGVGAGLANAGGHATVAYSTIAFNSDGVDNLAGTVTLGGTIVADSTGANCTGAISETSGHNLDSGMTCGFSKTTDITSKEPLLAPLANNGDGTLTHALKLGSPAIDRGGTAANGCPATDQRGRVRPDNGNDSGACDIGSFETQGVA